MNLIKSIEGNVIMAEFQKVDPAVILDKDCLEIFYETIEEMEKQSRVTIKEWNSLVSYIIQLSSQFKEQKEQHNHYLSLIN
ncbi:hypothetical protein [Brevibacillus sp. NRS-1366]|uniref:hypothetical protein n=1 Tax=Brevibacillus sp. NRS-1366 TaxID=3233899 RepID=UPI003D1DC586